MTNRLKENIKSVILVVLLLLTILLLYFYLSGIGELDFDTLLLSEEETGTNVELSDFISPETVFHSKGDGTYSAVKNRNDVYENALNCLISICKSSVTATEITAESYNEAISKNESITIGFRYGMPFSEYCKYFGVSRSSSFANIDYINSISFSDGLQDSIVIGTVSGKYFRLVANENYDWKTLICTNLEEYNFVFYRASDVLGMKSNVLIPISGTSNISSGYASKEYSIEKYTFRQGLAEEIFGETLNFVRRIVDNFANVTYIYGYGQKSLIFFATGSVEYNAEVSSSGSDGFFTDLQTALNFVEKYGGWEVEGDNSEFYLSAVSGTDESDKTFYFSQYINGDMIYANPAATVTVTVSGGEVSYYNRSTLRSSSAGLAQSKEVYSAVNAIANISEKISTGSEKSDKFTEFASSITKVQIGYYRDDDYLYPSWVVYTKDSRYYADLYSGEVYNID